jgi:hypothetical protein
MADEKLAKLREAVAGLGQIRSGTPLLHAVSSSSSGYQ